MLFATTAHAQTPPSCAYLHSPQIESRYAFTQASVIGLKYALMSWNGATAFEKEKDGLAPVNSLVAMMRLTKTSADAFACAEMVIPPYVESRDKETTGFIAKFLVTVYRAHKGLDAQLLALLRSLSNDTSSGVLADRIWTPTSESAADITAAANSATYISTNLFQSGLKRPGANGAVAATSWSSPTSSTVIQSREPTWRPFCIHPRNAAMIWVQSPIPARAPVRAAAGSLLPTWETSGLGWSAGLA